MYICIYKYIEIYLYVHIYIYIHILIDVFTAIKRNRLSGTHHGEFTLKMDVQGIQPQRIGSFCILLPPFCLQLGHANPGRPLLGVPVFQECVKNLKDLWTQSHPSSCSCVVAEIEVSINADLPCTTISINETHSSKRGADESTSQSSSNGTRNNST